MILSLTSSDSSGQPNRLNQHIFFSEGVHSEILSILKLPLEKRNDDFADVTLIFECCYDFFQKFCKNNPTNQKALHHHVEFMLDQRIRFPHIKNIMPALIEVYKNNRKLCSKLLQRQHILQYLRRLLDERDATILEFFGVSN